MNIAPYLILFLLGSAFLIPVLILMIINLESLTIGMKVISFLVFVFAIGM